MRPPPGHNGLINLHEHQPGCGQSCRRESVAPAPCTKKSAVSVSPCYCAPRKQGEEDNPLLVVGVYNKEITYDRYAFARGFGRFVIRYTWLATALGNFEQGSIQTESTAVAYWLTSGLKVAMARVGWNLLSPRYGLTRLPGELLKRYYSQGYPQLQEEDRPYHQYGPIVYTDLERHKQELRRQQGAGRDDSGARNKSRRAIPPPGSSSSSSAAHPPNRSQPPPPPPPALVVAVRDLW